MALLRCSAPTVFPSLLELCLLFLAATSLQARQSPCDTTLTQSGTDPNGYRLRGDRCEGLYVLRVSSPTLRVVSLVESFEDFDPAAATDLRIGWSARPASAPVHLRANTLRPHLYYRFDAVGSPGATSHGWPVALLRNLGLRKRDLGVLAWISQPIGGSTRDVYLPVRISQKATPAPTDRYLLLLVPGAELAEVFLSLSPVSADGRPGAFVQQDQPLQRGFYPAGRAIGIPITGLTRPGIYLLELSATLRAGGSSTTRLWFHHPG